MHSKVLGVPIDGYVTSVYVFICLFTALLNTGTNISAGAAAASDRFQRAGFELPFDYYLWTVVSWVFIIPGVHALLKRYPGVRDQVHEGHLLSGLVGCAVFMTTWASLPLMCHVLKRTTS